MVAIGEKSSMGQEKGTAERYTRINLVKQVGRETTREREGSMRVIPKNHVIWKTTNERVSPHERFAVCFAATLAASS